MINTRLDFGGKNFGDNTDYDREIIWKKVGVSSGTRLKLEFSVQLKMVFVRGEIPYKRNGDVRWKIKIKPLKETDVGVV